MIALPKADDNPPQRSSRHFRSSWKLVGQARLKESFTREWEAISISQSLPKAGGFKSKKRPKRIVKQFFEIPLQKALFFSCFFLVPNFIHKNRMISCVQVFEADSLDSEIKHHLHAVGELKLHLEKLTEPTFFLAPNHVNWDIEIQMEDIDS